MKKILVLHGPNLNLLGSREPAVYGSASLEAINSLLREKALQQDISLICKQSNHEGELIEIIQGAKNEAVDYIIINPAAYTHTSIALRDALLAVSIPFIEVHLSNIYQREAFRQHSYFSDIAQGVIMGFGSKGYLLALEAIIDVIH